MRSTTQPPILRWRFLVVIVAALIALARVPVIVDQTESIAVTEFGRPVRLLDEPGLHFKWPHQSGRSFDRRLQVDAPPPRELLTRDKKNLEVAWYTAWKIDDIDRFLRSVRTMPEASARLEELALALLAAELGNRDLNDLVQEGPDSSLGNLMGVVSQQAAAQALDEYGIAVQDVRLRRLNYPEEVRAAVFEQIRSERKRVAAATRAEGESRARQIRSAADRERAAILAEAEAEAARTLGKGEAEATRIANEAHAADPDFYRFLKTLEAYRSALDQRTTLILSTDSEFLKLLGQGEMTTAPPAGPVVRSPVASGSKP
ncbi:MAG: protease modulator HflC [Isosphaeraceae bacterium]